MKILLNLSNADEASEAYVAKGTQTQNDDVVQDSNLILKGDNTFLRAFF